MSKIAPVILVTRPLTQANEFRQILGQGARVVISPVIEIRYSDFSVQTGVYQTLIFASRNAVNAAARCMDLHGLNAIAVGDRTALAATGQGMISVSAGGNADDLVERVIAANPEGKVLFVRGRHSRGEIADLLNSRGIETDSVIAYDQIQTKLTAEACELLGGDAPVIIPLFSPRSAKLVASEVTEIRAPLALVGMSKAVLDSWDGAMPTVQAIADQPTAQAMRKETLRLMRSWA